MEEYQEITRVKKKFILPVDEFLKGEWLKEINKIFNYDKLDMHYEGDGLMVRFYKKVENGKKN